MPAEPRRPVQTIAPEIVAPAWHTAILVTLIVGVACTGAMLAARGAPIKAPPAGGRVAAVYLPMLVVQWGLVVYVSRIGRPRSALRALVGRGWRDVRRAAVDVGLAALLLVAVLAVEWLWFLATREARSPSLEALLPADEGQRVAWGFVAVSAGFCEEVVYRGYLQTQVTAWTGRWVLGVAAQAVLFGIAHADQGLGPAARLAAYGAALGVLAHARRSLLPGIACHVGLDLVAGLTRG